MTEQIFAEISGGDEVPVDETDAADGQTFDDEIDEVEMNAESSQVNEYLNAFGFHESEPPEPDPGQVPEPVPKSETSLGELACLICGGNAGKHVHYGGQACYSCKAFFRRSVKDDAFKKFACVTKNCKIDSKSWRSCKWCRFKKCLASGLKPSWVLDKTERKRRREKKKKTTATAASTTSTSTSQSESNTMVPFASPAKRCSQMVVSYSTDELMQIMTMALGVHKSLTRNLTRFYGRNPTLFGQITK